MSHHNDSLNNKYDLNHFVSKKSRLEDKGHAYNRKNDRLNKKHDKAIDQIKKKKSESNNKDQNTKGNHRKQVQKLHIKDIEEDYKIYLH